MDEVSQIWVVSGPGSFTGLRVSSAFCLGLGRSLNSPVHPLPTFRLFEDKRVFLPIRAQLAASMSREELLSSKEECLCLEGDEEVSVSKPQAQDKIVGFKGELWPSEKDLLRAVHDSLKQPLKKFELFYGMGAKAFGKPLPTSKAGNQPGNPRQKKKAEF